MSLDTLLHSAIGNATSDDDLKFVFVGGKGGVGKTTSSSAIATLFAEHCGKRVLLVSTDPAHSLSDAFLKDFTNEPTSPGTMTSGSLHVMEVDPGETMKRELGRWAELANEFAVEPSSSSSGGKDDEENQESNDMLKKIEGFQEWLSGIPGIDEATALSSAIEHIESDRYDLIVFDTAPTGHTLKLLGMPDILQAGIEKLQGWQSTIWTYWDVMKGMASSASLNRKRAKDEVATMLENYKRGIQKVALMLQDQRRTRFVVVCIAEYLSVSESQRLLQELKKNKVRASHVIVNQLVVDSALTKEELVDLEELAEIGVVALDKELLSKTIHACRLTTARKGIQEKYLRQLKKFPETEEILDGICEVPLLAEEVTGVDALRRFAKFMVKNPPSSVNKPLENSGCPKRLYDEQIKSGRNNEGDDKMNVDSNDNVSSWTPSAGDMVKIQGLVKAAQYNDMEGMIVSPLDPTTNRYGVRISPFQLDGKGDMRGKGKTLALQKQNLLLINDDDAGAKKAKNNNMDTDPSMMPTPTEQNVNKAKSLLDDPEIKAMVEENPKFKKAVQDCLENPMNFMKYISDPVMSPLIAKAAAKLNV